MEIEDFFTKTRWSILKEISRGKKSATEIAHKINNSVANTTIQLKMLEAYSIIRKTKPEQKTEAKKKIGKPKTPYELSQEIFFAGVLKPGMVEKKIIKQPDKFQQTLYNTAFLLNPDEQYCLMKFLLETDILGKIQGLSLLKNTEKEIELFILTEQILEIREKYSNYTVENLSGKTKKIISWSHNKKELEEGLSKGEEYFKNLINGQTIFQVN